MEIDHIFICVKPEALEAEMLKEFGLTEGTANQHLGQGTANRRFFFHNAFIELLFLRDDTELQSELTKATRLYERLTSKGKNTSPFGICLRPKTDNEKQELFSSWAYRPMYLPKQLKIDIGHSPLHEPMWFFLHFASRPDKAKQEKQQPLRNPKGFREITSLHITIPNTEQLSGPALCVRQIKGVEIVEGDEHLLQIGFDNERHAQSWDFRPTLPLVFRW
ncbi:MAG: VOC family protein [Chloroflexota bacterium]